MSRWGPPESTPLDPTTAAAVAAANEDLLDQQHQNLSDDDLSDANSDTGAESPTDEQQEDPLVLAIEDLESRAVECLNDFKSHPGIATITSGPSKQSIHEELASLLRPVLEIAAHVGPSTARSLCNTYTNYNIDSTVDEIYNRLNSDLILPVLLETAQSDTIPAKRASSLSFFSSLFKECQKSGSYLDKSTAIQTVLGPYGPGQQQSTLSVPSLNIPPSLRPLLKQRGNKHSIRKAELLRYWVQSSIPSLTPGTYTSFTSDASAASRGVLSASSSIKPSLRHIAERISNADDAGALRLFLPVMRMIGGVLHRLFLSPSSSSSSSGSGAGGGNKESDAALRSSCIKFVEIVVLCFSSKVQGGDNAQQSRRRGQNLDDFSLEDLPTGHPIITRESLEEIGEYAFTTLRGLTIIGGQVKIDSNLLPDVLSSTQGFFEGSSGYGSSPSTQIVSIIKPAALAYLEIESSVQETEDKQFKIDRSEIELDFSLSQKSYALTINAVSMLATNRPVFFKDSATCLARRTMDPPKYDSSINNALSKTAVTGVQSHLKASCLTLLRHSLSVTSGGWEILHRALASVGMELQANKALNAAKQQAALKTAGRAARNRAAIFYEWDQSEEVKRVSKRQRATDDALAQMRAAKAARGLGSGVQLPSSMVDACELVLVNLCHLPSQRPGSAAGAGGSSEATRKKPIDLDFIVDAVMTNGASLAADESRWYDRNGGAAWSRVAAEDKMDTDGEKKEAFFKLEPKTLQAASVAMAGEASKNESDEAKIFDEQCKTAASDAFSRIVLTASSARSKSLGNIGNQIAARLAWTLRGVHPSSALKDSLSFSEESVNKAKQSGSDENGTSDTLLKFSMDRPLVASCLALDIVSSGGTGGASAVNSNTGGANSQQKGVATGSTLAGTTSSLANHILNEAYMQSFGNEGHGDTNKELYSKSLDVFVSAVVHACNRANEKPNDNDRKRAATLAASSLPQQLAMVPSATPSAFKLASSLCDIEAVNKKAADVARKASHQTLAASAAAHAAKTAAEKRATAALLALRDAAIQRSKSDVRRSAVDCAVAIAAGRLPGSPNVEDKALKLVMNVLFPRSADLADAVISSATEELERAAAYAIENQEKIQKANKVAIAKKKSGDHHNNKNTLQPLSDEEKTAMERVRKPAVLFMALCVRRPEIIVTLMSVSSKEGADVLSKAVQNNMPKLARAAATKHGASAIALRVSDMVKEKEVPLLLAFLDNLAQSSSDNALPSQELIDACHEIQAKRLDADGKKDARYVISVVSGVKREALVEKLPEFVAADDRVFKAALMRMSERLGRHALVFRDEPDKENPSLNGMTLCEQMVFLHRLDFRGVGLPQKRYLDAIRICLEEDEVFTDRVIMAALDYMSGAFLAGEEGLPLAYMRTIILTCSKHESLHSWICHVLLPRLIEGKIYTDRRQWEGWMRCAKMLENTGAAGVSSIREAIQQLPEEQLEMYLAIRKA